MALFTIARLRAAAAGGLAAAALGSLAESNGGLVLLHDAQDRTAAALPQMLRAIKEHGYRIVHLEWK